MSKSRILNSEFRNKTDLLFFTNRLDLDCKNYKDLFWLDIENNSQYILDRFYKGSEIFWDVDSEGVWNSRLTILLDLESVVVTKAVDKFVNKRLVALFRNRQDLNIKYYTEFIQYLEFAKVKYSRKENLSQIRNYLLELPNSFKVEKVIEIVRLFIPFIFKDVNEFASQLCRKIIHSPKNLLILRELERLGVKYNRQLLVDCFDLVLAKPTSRKTAKAFMALMEEKEVVSHFKTLKVGSKIDELMFELDFKELEHNKYVVFNNLTVDCERLVAPLLELYIDKLLLRGSRYIKSNCNRCARLCQALPSFEPKMVFHYFSSKNKLEYVREFSNLYPSLKQYIPFL